MHKRLTPIPVLAGLLLGGYGMYVGELDGSKPLWAGRQALLQGQYQQAVVHFDAALEEIRRSLRVPLFGGGGMEKQENRFEANRGLATAYLKLAQPDKASEYLEQARALYSYGPDLRFLAADIALAREDFESALDELDQALENDPRLHYLYPKRARIHLRLGNCPEAVADLQRAIDNAPGSAMAPETAGVARELAWLLSTHPDARCRDGNRALNTLQPAGAFGDRHFTERAKARLYATRAAAYAESGDFAAAREWALRAEALIGPGADLYPRLQAQLNAYNIGEAWRE